MQITAEMPVEAVTPRDRRLNRNAYVVRHCNSVVLLAISTRVENTPSPPRARTLLSRTLTIDGIRTLASLHGLLLSRIGSIPTQADRLGAYSFVLFAVP
jgi:hypothetical protein